MTGSRATHRTIFAVPRNHLVLQTNRCADVDPSYRIATNRTKTFAAAPHFAHQVAGRCDDRSSDAHVLAGGETVQPEFEVVRQVNRNSPPFWHFPLRQRASAMIATVTVARFNQDNDTSIALPRRSISVRPVEYVGNPNRRSGRPRVAVRAEPSTSLAKRLFDVTAAGSALLFFAPIWLGFAIAIKLTSPGPVLFAQKRYGYRNKSFKIYKFRSMRVDACDSGVQQAVEGDARVTAIGRLMRKTSLDEIPQLINVVKGDMSLVGPRPHVPGMQAANLLYEDLVPYYFQRHSARPGITGLAQISGCRGSTAESGPAIARIDYDLEYIEKWSLALDIKILFQTVRREFLSGSGY
jgi:exopolysaccharide biosynthesis polyprenyl glycosylphosphotransferase